MESVKPAVPIVIDEKVEVARWLRLIVEPASTLARRLRVPRL
jgi:hypothetical protein